MCILNEFFTMYEVYACVTKHGDWCLSLAGANWVSDRAGINFIEIYAYERCSLFMQSRVASNSKVLRKKWTNLIKI